MSQAEADQMLMAGMHQLGGPATPELPPAPPPPSDEDLLADLAGRTLARK
jgi:hypothetical protein